MKPGDKLPASLLAVDDLLPHMTPAQREGLEQMVVRQARRVRWERRLTWALWILWSSVAAGIYVWTIATKVWLKPAAPVPPWEQSLWPAALIVIMIASFWVAVIQTILYFVCNRTLDTNQLQLQLARIEEQLAKLREASGKQD